MPTTLQQLFVAIEFQDKQLVCADCGQSFVFTSGEQEFYASKQLANQPKRCPDCRLVQRARRQGLDFKGVQLACADCGQLTRVPFQPRGIKPVYCPSCFHKLKQLDS